MKFFYSYFYFLMALVLSWNCHGLKSETTQIKDLINEHQPAVIALQETYLKLTDVAQFHNFTSYGKDYINIDRACGGVALLTSHDYPVTHINL